ncbi:MAG: O-antigen ligase family protein [Thiomargarita sp.]|nr:O-antigen ligase family protein [Thiomargarita sp.]
MPQHNLSEKISPDKSIFIALLILIIWLPMPLASNRPWAWAIMAIWILILSFIWLKHFYYGRVKFTPVFYHAKYVLILWSLWLIYIIFQIIPLPYSWVQWISPKVASLQFFIPHTITLSIEPYATSISLLHSICYILLFMLVLLLVNRRKRLRWLAYSLLLSGLFQAIYGSMMTLSNLEYGFFHQKIYGLGVATGTFINRNHFAGYLEICLAIGIGLLISQLSHTSNTTWKQHIKSLLSWLMSNKMQLRLSLVIMVIALVLTHSRMGNTAFFASLLIAGIIGLILSRHAPRSIIILFVSIIIIDIIIVGTWFGVEKVVNRIETTRMITETRDDVDIYSLNYLQDYLWTGSGLGSFYSTFPTYQGHDIKGFYDHAHNDYLEFAVETGIIGLLILIAIMILALKNALIAQYRRHDSLCRGMAFSATMAMIAIIIHSSVDFNLQIPANAATFMIILALAWIANFLPTVPAHKKRSKHKVK